MSVPRRQLLQIFSYALGPASSPFGIDSPSLHRTPPNQPVLPRLLSQLLNTNWEERKK